MKRWPTGLAGIAGLVLTLFVGSFMFSGGIPRRYRTLAHGTHDPASTRDLTARRMVMEAIRK